MKIAQTILTIAVVIIAVDFLGFLAWGMSGQMPVDGFYVGAITRNILQAVFF